MVAGEKAGARVELGVGDERVKRRGKKKKITPRCEDGRVTQSGEEQEHRLKPMLLGQDETHGQRFYYDQH
jgi:hypothetical protein